MSSRAAVSVAVLLSAIWVARAAAESAGPTFAKKPTATRVGDGSYQKVRIDFAVDRETDVTVDIEDGAGRIVRHLVAGMLGKNPPEPLKAGSLVQSLEWDGKDDDGNQILGGPGATAKPSAEAGLKVRVGLGLGASYAGQAFADKDRTGPNHLEGVLGLAAASDGRVYVLDRCNGQVWGGTRVLVFRRDGVYERTIKPFPSNTPIEQAKAAGAITNSFGAFNPVKHVNTGLTSFYPAEDIAHQPAMTADGRLLLAVAPCRLAMLDRDGGIPESSYAGPALAAGLGFKGYPALVAAADSKSVYLVGLGTGKKVGPAVYRVALPERGPAEVWFGDPAKAGDDRTHLDDPRAPGARRQGPSAGGGLRQQSRGGAQRERQERGRHVRRAEPGLGCGASQDRRRLRAERRDAD